MELQAADLYDRTVNELLRYHSALADSRGSAAGVLRVRAFLPSEPALTSSSRSHLSTPVRQWRPFPVYACGLHEPRIVRGSSWQVFLSGRQCTYAAGIPLESFEVRRSLSRLARS